MLANFLLSSLLTSVASAHMRLSDPVPLGLDVDGPELMLGPLERFNEQAPFPCRGHLGLAATFDNSTAPVWQAGSLQEFTLTGSSPHYGGSCQASLSYDNGLTWKVIKSFPGSCPHRNLEDEQTFNMTIPEGAAAKEGVIFGWSWFNREQEMYHNCAVVNIATAEGGAPVTGGTGNFTDGSSNVSRRAETEAGSTGLEGLPDMLIADVGDSNCKTPLSSAETEFPDMGDDKERIQWPVDQEYPLEKPVCA